MQVLLKGGTIVGGKFAGGQKMDILIKNGKIAKIAEEIKSDGHEAYDVSGLTVSPGFVDMHVHLREPGQEYKETIETASQAAANGGFTTIVGMPNTTPPIDNRSTVEYVINRGKKADCRVLTSGSATKAAEGREMAELGDMIRAGACAISDDAAPVQSADLMQMVMHYCSMFDVPFLAHCEDKTMTHDAVMNEGIVCTVTGLRPWPREAEEIMIWRNILIAKRTGCRLHIQHVTTRGGCEALRWAKGHGIKVTAETCPHYFSLTDEKLNTYDTNAKVCPPLRTADDKKAIIEALADDTIDCIATDHAPHSIEEKEVEMQHAAFGMVGLETAFALCVTNLVEPDYLTLEQVIEKLSFAPSRILGLEDNGLAEGARADITLLDVESKWTVDSGKFFSKGRNTPFDGMSVRGKVLATIYGGQFSCGADRLSAFEAKAHL